MTTTKRFKLTAECTFLAENEAHALQLLADHFIAMQQPTDLEAEEPMGKGHELAFKGILNVHEDSF